MSSEQQSCLRFSVEESIWFQKGQEVSELISIALDPDIQIYEQDQYVSIRGALLLTGEYQVRTEADAEEEGEEYHPQARVVQEVEEREDGVCALHHRFPVDITIPKNRIQSLDDIYVAIESFDYSVPTRGCLQLDAELSISGIYGHQQSSPAWEEEQEEAYEVEPNRDHEEVYEVEPNRDHEEAYASQNDQNEAFSFEQKSEVQEEEEAGQEEAFEYEPMYRSANSDNEYEEDTYQYYTAEEEEEEEILNQDEIDANVQYNYNNDGEYAPFEVEARKAPVTEEEAPYNPADYIYQDQDVSENTYAPLYSLHANKYDQDEEVEESSNVVSLFNKRKGHQAVADAKQNEYVDSDEPRDENDLSLTKIFADDDGEDFTKVKICIVQQGESMDHIAERYDVSIQQLIRVNRLSTDDHVNEGQLLYIPVKASSKSQ
ncbi:stage VI sporulation protein D [Sutcliffiella horikoshii]|uniref:stage VI sporulation protein D n=1 Tax=Sutcliffiella horikoshii TaxID=79883 RepID=UPI00203AF4BF|nr:stage VI sporulation protein D [Sutcliffiella horikoshii]MCM3619338.1 stage VI sporulation protein D [Sutcliffiella horikoshii]